MITARYIFETSQVEPGFRIHRKTLKLAKIAPIIALLFIAIGAYQAVTSTNTWLEGFPLLSFGVVLLLLAKPLALFQFRRAIRRSPSYGCELTWTFEPEQVTVSGQGFHSSFTWKKIYSATISSAGLLLYPQKNLFHWIPVSAFASREDFDAVLSFMAQNGVRTVNT